MTDEAIATLSELEKDTLRLLLAGHDAKSIARECDLSVHTINDRLRSTRRKLGVTSSREAARLLGEAERADHKFHAGKQIGIAGSDNEPHDPGHSQRRQGTGNRLVWFVGGMIMIGLILAVAMMVAPSQDNASLQRADGGVADVSGDIAQSAGVSAAQAWVALVDDSDWAQSYRTAGAFFQQQVTQEQWVTVITPVRQPLGAMTSRAFGQVTKPESLPGAPAGDYEVIEFQTDFANKAGAVETVVMISQDTGWKVVGYFIR